MAELTQEQRADLIAMIEIRRRMERRSAQVAARTSSPARRSAAVRAGGRVLLSPVGMAHLAQDREGLEPACVHYVQGQTDGWHSAPFGWDGVPAEISRCRSCIALD
jgi:hypothetical protein